MALFEHLEVHRGHEPVSHHSLDAIDLPIVHRSIVDDVDAELDTSATPRGTAQARAERAAALAGVESQVVEKLPFDLSALEDEGVFVNVDAKGFGLLDRRLDWEALGISLPKQHRRRLPSPSLRPPPRPLPPPAPPPRRQEPTTP